MATSPQLDIEWTGLQTEVKNVTRVDNGLTLKLKPALGPTANVVCLYCHRSSLNNLLGVCAWARTIIADIALKLGRHRLSLEVAAHLFLKVPDLFSPIMQTHTTQSVARESFTTHGFNSWTDYREKCCP
eukprot:COSAG02_NODE_872_length_16321_cov_6.491062_10_plen_129_part_00